MAEQPNIDTDFAGWTAHNWAQLIPAADSNAALVAIRYISAANALAHSQARVLKPFKKHGITGIADFRLLGLLRHIGEAGMSTQRAAEYLEFDATTVSTRLNRLEHHGHVQRREHPTSRRTHLVTLDPRSEALVDEMYETLVQNHERFFGALTSAEHEQLCELLGRL